MKQNILSKMGTFYCSLMLFVSCVVLTGCNNGSIKATDYIELGQYKGLNVEKAVHQVTDEELEDEINTLAGAYATSEKLTEGKVESGDVANIDYVGKKDGVAFDGGTASGYDLTIGSGQFIPGFEDGLIGVEAGKTVDLNLTFPENYGKTELAGQDVVFTVTVNYITRKTLPEVNDEFIQEVSEGQYEDLASYEAALEQQIIDEYEEYNKLQYYEDLWNAAVDNATIIKDIPTEMINEKVSTMVVNSQKYAASYGISFEEFLKQYMGMTKDEFNAQAAEYAKKAAKESLVLQAIAQAEGITVSEEDMNKALAEYIELGKYESEEDFKAKNDMKEFEEYVLLSKVEDFLAENAASASSN